MTTSSKDGRKAVVIGVGNEFRRDDGAGPAVVARLSGQVPEGTELVVSDGEPVRMIEAWDGATLAVVVDAVRAEPAVPGRLHRLDLDRAGAALPGTVSSHGLGLGDCDRVRLGNRRGSIVVHARAFDGMQKRVVVVEGIWPNNAFEEGIGINLLTSADPGLPGGGAVF